MSMQTVIMAGGEGARLRPLTQSMPKPLAPLCGEPVMGYTLRLLQRHGINSATATLWYRPDDVMREFGLQKHGVTLRYSTETTPLGTAGSVLRAIGQPHDTTLVLSGDGLTHCDLTQAYAFHRACGAAATLVLTKVDIPLAYGVVVTREDGRIVRFVEKPDWSRVTGSLVNTGIYFLEPEALRHIPRDEPYDFGRQLFPRLLQLDLPVYGFVSDEYWCDVGDPAAFLRAQADLLTGRAGFAATCMGVRKLKDGYISFDSYVDPRAHVAPDAVIRSSCILPGARVESGVRMTGSILCCGAQSARGSVLTEGSVLGSGSCLAAFSRCEGGRLWSGVRTLPGTVVRTVLRRENQTLCVRGGKVFATEPAQIAQLAGALLQTQRAEKLVVMHNGTAAASQHVWLGALANYGAACVWDVGAGSSGMLGSAIRRRRADGGILVFSGGAVFYDNDGFPLNDNAGSRVQAAWQRLEAPSVHPQEQAICRDTTQRGLYLQELTEKFRTEAGLRVSLRGEQCCLYMLAQDALRLAGHTEAEGGDVTISVRGDTIRLTAAGRMLDEQTEWLLCARALQRQNMPVYDLLGFGAAADGFQPLDDSDGCRIQRMLMQDELSRVLFMLQHFSREKPEEALHALPLIAQKKLEIPCETCDKSRVLAELLRDAAPCARGGLEKVERTARAHIAPDPALPLLRITAYARSAENAQELCDFLDERVRRTLLKQEKNDITGMQ